MLVVFSFGFDDAPILLEVFGFFLSKAMVRCGGGAVVLIAPFVWLDISKGLGLGMFNGLVLYFKILCGDGLCWFVHVSLGILCSV